MKTAILYSQTKPSPDHQILIIYTDEGPVKLYIRSDVVVNADALRALDMAKPRKGEMVLNSVELP